MSSDTVMTVPESTSVIRAEGRFFVVMALVSIATALAGFGPAMVDPASRKAPLTWAVVAHGVVFGAWLVLFLVQALLVFTRRVALHRLLGRAGVGLAIIMLVSGFFTANSMARRGYDLSGDLIGEAGDPVMVLVFQLGDLLCFGILIAMGILYRGHPAVHKRLMLLATVGALMPAALSHVIGHSPFLRSFHPAIILIPYAAFLCAGAAHDRILLGRVHPVSLWVALAVFAWSNLRAIVIGPSNLWREFAIWLIR